MTSFFLVSFLLCVAFASADITLTPFADVCFGDTTSSRCSVTGTSLRWRYNGTTNTFTSGVPLDQVLLMSPSINTKLTSNRNRVLISDATVNVSSSNVVSSLDGTVIECESMSTSESLNFTISFNIKNQANISYVDVEEFSATEVIVTWEGAECVDYYVIEYGDMYNTTTSERLVIEPGNNCSLYVVSGINFLGQNFTSVSTEFCFTEYVFNVETVMDDSNFYVVTEANVTNQPPITSCSVSLNDTVQNCSETDKVVRFDVKPGSYYEYIVVIDNIVGPSNVSQNINIPTTTPFPTVPPPDKCDIWYILFIVVAAALVASLLLIACLCLRICIFERRMCCSKCQNSSKWRSLFCCEDFTATEAATNIDKKKLEDKTSSL